MRTTDRLVAADALLDSFYETVFRAVVERNRSQDGTPPPEAPPELVAFARFKPARAVAQPQVRKALRELLDEDAALAPLVARRHACRGVDGVDAAAMAVAAEAGDMTQLARIASCVAATRPDGWETVLAAAGAAASAYAAGLQAGTAATEKQVDAQRRRVDAAMLKAEDRGRDLDRRRAEVERLRSERDDARAAIGSHTHAEARARERLDTVQAELGELRLERDALIERVASLEAGFRGQESSNRDLERTLRARIDSLESALIPDLEPHAAALERLADDLRETVRSLTSGDGTERKRRRRSPDIPKGIMPDSSKAAEWALTCAGLVILVDGYNVSKQEARGWDGKSLEDQRQLLVSRCAQVRRRDGAELRIVFDSSESIGAGHQRHLPDGVVVEFSGGPIADDAIVETVEGLHLDTPVVVVTSDRELQGRVAALGAAPIPSLSFLEAIDAPRR